MLSNQEIIKTAHQRIDDALSVTSWWRANEVRDNYNLIEGNQWLENSYDRQNKDGMPIRTINKLAPIVDSICGFEIQNRTEVKYVPRLNTNAQVGFTDMLNSTVNYIQDDSQSEFQNSQAFKDMLICGVGVTDTIINYDSNPDGEVKVERVFPYLTLWDITARAKNLEDANWVIRAKIVDQDAMENYLKDADGTDEPDINFGAGVDARFLDFFDTIATEKSLSIIYEYQWREKTPFYRIENPFVNSNFNLETYPNVFEILELAQALQEKYNFNVREDKIFSIETGDFANLKKLFELLDLQFKYTKQKKFKYYRAIIIGNKVIEKAENFSQKGFSLKFMTGKFSEVGQCYYGIIRAAKEPQRLLNQSVSDYEGFLRTIPKGGVEIEADAVPNMEAFVQTYTKAREVTIYNPGGLAKTRPKITPPVPSGLLDMINFAATAIMETTGVTQDFMGITDSKMMTATLNRQLVRQGLTTLSSYFDAKKFYTIAQGKLFIDCVQIMVENSEGRLIRVMDQGEIKYVPLLKNGLAAEYDVIVEDIPATPSERQDTFEKLLQLAGLLANKPNPVDITPLALQYSPLKEEEIKKVLDMMQPPPPSPPDPMAQQILMAETQLKQSTAEKNSAVAAKTTIEAMLKRQELEYESMLKKAQIEKLLSDARLNNAKTTSEITNNIMENQYEQ